MKASQADIPSELLLHSPLSATYQNLTVNIIELDVFILNNILVYMVCLPLTNHVNYVSSRTSSTIYNKRCRYQIHIYPCRT